jgi:hypothetical protein
VGDRVSEAWRAVLIGKLKESAAGRDGRDVIEALEAVSEQIWNAGLDHDFKRLPITEEDFAGDATAFDIGWLTLLLIQLRTR